MAKQTPEDALAAIEAIIRHHGQSVAASDISRALPTPIPPRTLQYRLNRLIADNRLIREGTGRWARYRLPDAAVAEAPQSDDGSDAEDNDGDLPITLSTAAGSVRDYVRQRPEARKPVGYNRDFLGGSSSFGSGLDFSML